MTQDEVNKEFRRVLKETGSDEEAAKHMAHLVVTTRSCTFGQALKAARVAAEFRPSDGS
jgi:hypothetical protein